MKTTLETLLEIPCFKCLFWDPIRESSLNCDPNRCQELTEWLLKQAESQETENRQLILNMRTQSVKNPIAK